MISNDDEGVREAARAIRPYLTDLVGPEAAKSLDRRIADYLTRHDDETTIVVRLRAILEEHSDTAWFLGRVLADKPYGRPPYHQPAYQRGIATPAGDEGFVHADRYACPRGDYVWYRPDIGTPVPDCPTHGCKLIRS